MAKLKYLVVHCTATPQGHELSADRLHEMHTAPVSKGGRGWKQVGYSAMIHLGGLLTILVPYDQDDNVDRWEITNGVKGINSQSRHLVYVGGMNRDNTAPMDTRTAEQNIALANYVRQTIAAHPNILVAGHNEFANKACPSFDVPQWLRAIGVADKNIKKQR